MGFDPQVTGDLVAETHMDLGLVLVLLNTHGFGSKSPMSRLVMVPKLKCLVSALNYCIGSGSWPPSVTGHSEIIY